MEGNQSSLLVSKQQLMFAWPDMPSLVAMYIMTVVSETERADII